MTEPLPTPGAKVFWQEVWRENAEKLKGALLAAVDQDKGEYGRCPHCGFRVEMRWPDVRARTDAVKALHELAGLRPKPDDNQAQDLQVYRRVILPDGTELDAGLPGADP